MALLQIDARLMQPPEPFERVMELIDRVDAGDIIELLLYREPFPLYRVLERNGYTYGASTDSEGTVTVRIGKRA